MAASATYAARSRGGQRPDYATADSEVRTNYAAMAAPPETTQGGPSQGKPVFVMNQDIPGENNLQLQDMFKSLCRSVDTKNINGVQRIGGLWRLYIADRESRIRLITGGLQIRASSVRVYDKNPYLPQENENATRVLIKDIPLSVHESVIHDGLESINCKIYGPVIYPKLRVDGKLTQCLTGDRVVYIDPPTQPLPRFMRFNNFKARVFHHGQPDSDANITCSRCLQPGHHRTKCSNQLLCRSCRKPGHLQNACPAVIGEKQQRSEPSTQTPASSQSGDQSREEAVSRPTTAQTRHTAQNKDQAHRITSSVPQTRSKSAAATRTSTHEKGSRDCNQRTARESAVPGKVMFAEPRSRSSSMPNLTEADQQPKLAHYWHAKPSAESNESVDDSDETDGDQSSVIVESMESPEEHRSRDTESKKRKRRRKNTKDSNGK